VPDSVGDGRRHWITRYLNGRFLRLPAQSLARDPPGSSVTYPLAVIELK
jgi:hypothetical protein